MPKAWCGRLWRSLNYEEVHLKAYANGLEARIGIGQPLDEDIVVRSTPPSRRRQRQSPLARILIVTMPVR
jgi:hypothetical protein